MNISQGRKVDFAAASKSTCLEIIFLSQLMENFLINKNQTKFNTFIPARQWQPSKSLFHSHLVHALMLKIYFIFTALAIMILNGIHCCANFFIK